MKCHIRNKFSIGLIAPLLLSFAIVASAQIDPAGTTTTINNGAGDQTDPHV